MDRKISVLLLPLILSVLMLTGCEKYRDIRVDSCKIESISPVGLKAVDAGFSVDVHNPVKEITISEISGVVYYDGAPLGSFTSPDLVIPGKQTSNVSFVARATLDKSVNIMQLMAMASGFKTEKFTLDISLRINVKGGIKKKLDLKGLPVEDFFRKVSYESA